MRVQNTLGLYWDKEIDKQLNLSFNKSFTYLDIAICKFIENIQLNQKLSWTYANFVKFKTIQINMLRYYFYSHSIVPGGFEVKSYRTLFTSLTLLIIFLEISVKSSLLNI